MQYMAWHERAPKWMPTRDTTRVFVIFVTSCVKLNANFLAFPSVNFFTIWLSCNHIQSLLNTLFLLKSVRANLIYLEQWQIGEYWKNRLNNLDFFPVQNVRQCYFHDVAKCEEISPKESINIKEFWSKWGIYLLVIRRDVAMVTALIQKLTAKTVSLILTVPILINH